MAGLLDNPEAMKKLMQSPLLQMGLGILSNNKGQYALQNALGGAGQGFAQSQEYAQQDQANQLRKQQFDMQKAQYDQQQAKQAKLDAWQSSYGQPNTGGVAVSGGYSPSPIGTDSPNYGVVKNQDTYTPNNKFDIGTWLQNGMGSGAIDPLQYITASQKAGDDFSMDKGYIFNKHTGQYQKIEGYDSGDKGTNDTKNYEYAKKNNNYKGTLEDFIRIKPQAMMPVQMAQLGVAQGNLGIREKELNYNTPQPKAQSFSVKTPDGMTHTFKDAKSLKNFKFAAGLN